MPRFLRSVLRRVRRLVGPKAPASKRVSDWPAISVMDRQQGSGTDSSDANSALIAFEADSLAHREQLGWGAAYGVVKSEFDPLFYGAQNNDILSHGLDPVGHYLRAGARESRDPTPWFCTAEYRRTYMQSDDLRGENPFFHYLKTGRALGYAPRAPLNYDIFCDELSLSPAQVSDAARARMDDVRGRLRSGVLGEMVEKASALDPLIDEAWRAGLRVRVPPASNALGVRRIGHLIDLQSQAQHRRARAVIVVQADQMEVHGDVFRSLIDSVIDQAGDGQTVTIVTRAQTLHETWRDDVRVVSFAQAMPRVKDYAAGRTLVEFIRSLRPDIVVNLEAALLTDVTRSLGKALAATRPVYHYLSCAGGTTAQWAETGSRFYRAIDLNQRVIVPDCAARDALTEQFCLPADVASAIWVADEAFDGLATMTPAKTA